MHYAIVAIVHCPSRANWPEHGRYDSGYRWAVARCPTIIEAEAEAARLAAEQPLPAEWAYEPMHRPAR
jgi:hypothetical protein